MTSRSAEILDPGRRVDWVPLRAFIVLRWIAVIGQLSALVTARLLFHLQFATGLAVLVVGALAMANIVALFIHPENKRLTECEAARHLVFDVVQLTLLLGLTGGLTNPFALLMLVPVTVSATALKRRTTAMVGTAAIGGVSLVALWHLPLATSAGVLQLPPTLALGFWAAIVIGIAFVATYVQRVTLEVMAMSDALLATQMALAREQKLTDLGGIVAAAAHELGTPLATIKLASSELIEELSGRPEVVEDLQLIASQADRCRDILRSMGRAGIEDPHLSQAPIGALVREAAHPHDHRGRNVNWDIAPAPGGDPRQPQVARRPEVLHGLRNLIQNAVDFAREDVWIDIAWDDATILVRIVDDGPGFHSDMLGRIGEPLIRGRPAESGRSKTGYDGMGLGLFIAKTLLERSGADVTFDNGTRRPGATGAPSGGRRGAIVEVSWPREALAPGAVAAVPVANESLPVEFFLKKQVPVLYNSCGRRSDGEAMADFGATFAATLIAILVSAGVAAVVALVLIRRSASSLAPVAADPDRRSIFVFERQDLIDASPGAQDLLARGRGEGSDWARMLTALAPTYPRMTQDLARLDEIGRVDVPSRDGKATLTAVAAGSRIRIALSDGSDAETDAAADTASEPLRAELEGLRAVSDKLPFPVWRQCQEGVIIWANAAYLEAVRDLEGGRSWPPPSLFSDEALATVDVGGHARRLCRGSEATETWFDCRAAEIDGDKLYSAVNIDAAVTAERQLRDFMQTLTKTFSHLTTGLAIFDRQRRLALFNPALTELTGLPVDFLASRPTLYAVLDRLREKRMLPEPKDYGTWRRQMSDLEAAAIDGTYCETWSLHDGRTYRITGRPHPGGAVAFLFEDISAEMTLTRRFRSELELGQAVIDALDEAIVVFAPNGHLTMVNRAYQSMWASNVGDTLETPTVTDMSRLWMARSDPTPVWGDIRDFVLHARERSSWEDVAPLADGSKLRCRVLPLPGGSTLVGFGSPRGERDAQRARAAM